MNRMLHYSPEYDESENLIWEEPNLVKQKRDPLPFVSNYMDDILVTSLLKPTYEETVEEHFKNVEKAVDRYGSDAEDVLRGRAMNVAKKQVKMKNTDRLK
jgi:hypothetical protein